MLRVFVILVCLISTISADDKGYSEFIKVEGKGSVKVVPDYAIVKMGIHSTNNKVDSSQATVAKISSRLFSLCSRLNIDTTQIKTTNYSVNQKTRYNKDREKEIIGFEVEVLYDIRINRLSIIDTLLAESILLGSNKVSDIKFMSSKTDSIQMLVRDLAMKDATKSAKDILKSSGRNVGKLIKVTDDYRGNFNISSNHSVSLSSPSFSMSMTPNQSTTEKKPVYIKVLPNDIEIAENIFAVFQIK